MNKSRTMQGGTRSDLAAYARFRAVQRTQRRTRGQMRRSKYLLDQVQGNLERGTRAKNRGPYPQHLIDNCNAMRARNGAP